MEKKEKEIRHDWSVMEVKHIYNQPVLELVYQAAQVHRVWHKPGTVQLCTLLAIAYHYSVPL